MILEQDGCVENRRLTSDRLAGDVRLCGRNQHEKAENRGRRAEEPFAAPEHDHETRDGAAQRNACHRLELILNGKALRNDPAGAEPECVCRHRREQQRHAQRREPVSARAKCKNEGDR